MSPGQDAGVCGVPGYGIVSAVFLVLLLASAGCSSPAASFAHRDGLPETAVAPFPVAIRANPVSYTPAMSSTPGIALTPQAVRTGGDGGVRYTWKTDFGHFLSWDAPAYRVEDLGAETTNGGDAVYWTWHAGAGQEPVAQKVHITLDVTDTASGALLGTGAVDILIPDGIMARVQPS